MGIIMAILYLVVSGVISLLLTKNYFKDNEQNRQNEILC